MGSAERIIRRDAQQQTAADELVRRHDGRAVSADDLRIAFHGLNPSPSLLALTANNVSKSVICNQSDADEVWERQT